jgi:hypothetical protein
MFGVTDFLGIPGAGAPQKLEDDLYNQEAMNPSGYSGFEAAAGGALAFPLIMMVLWIISLIMTAISMSKMNTGIAANGLVKLSPADRDILPKIGTASSFLWAIPFVNIIISSIFTHKVRVAGL